MPRRLKIECSRTPRYAGFVVAVLLLVLIGAPRYWSEEEVDALEHVELVDDLVHELDDVSEAETAPLSNDGSSCSSIPQITSERVELESMDSCEHICFKVDLTEGWLLSEMTLSCSLSDLDEVRVGAVIVEDSFFCVQSSAVPSASVCTVSAELSCADYAGEERTTVSTPIELQQSLSSCSGLDYSYDLRHSSQSEVAPVLSKE